MSLERLIGYSATPKRIQKTLVPVMGIKSVRLGMTVNRRSINYGQSSATRVHQYTPGKQFTSAGSHNIMMLTCFSHYVAFIRKALQGRNDLPWVMFNDEKVVKVEDIEEMKKTAYMYFFSRV